MSHSLATTASRRLMTGTVVGVAALTVLATAPASAVGIDLDHHASQRAGQHSEPGPGQDAGRHKGVRDRTLSTLDGFVIRHTPCGIGTPSDFDYEWDDVVFHSRVWETGPDEEGATKVDLTVKTMRGDGLTDLQALRSFLTEYHEKDPAEWELTPVQIGPYDGYSAGDKVFYFVSAGVAAEVTIDRSRFSEEELTQTARGFRPE
ncbi:MAG TPA: hypothetical protein VFT31_08240 [Kribbella sp.]|nr:hypothetical protein [Kribbella sp.]